MSRLPTGEPEIFASIQGEGPTCGLPSVFVRLAMCNLRCSWCFVPDTPILMGDWSWKSLGDLTVGDEVISVLRSGERGRHQQLVRAAVTRVVAREAASVAVNGSLRCTPDHRFWLTGKDEEGRSAVHSGWREIHRAAGKRALFTTQPFALQRDLYERGWLSGMADGDGCFWTLAFRRGYRRFRLALTDGALLERARTFAARAGYTLRPGVHRHSGFRGPGTLDCLWLTADEEVRRFERWITEDVDDNSWRWGYVGGILDAEGSFSAGALRIAQLEVSGDTRARIERVLDGLRNPYTKEKNGYYLHRSSGSAWRTLANARPKRQSILDGALSHHPHASRVIEDIEVTGRRETVLSLTTTAGSFIAGGFVVKNCDTKYTWDWAHYDPKLEIVDLLAPDVARRVRERAPAGVRNVVVTGGEPLLQADELAELAGRLRAEGLRVEIETNGTIEPPARLAAHVDQWNVSPKLASSGNPTTREVPSALAWFAAQANAYFKLVVVEPGDIAEAAALVARYGVPPDRVLLMPEGTDAKALAERSRWLAGRCQELGYRLGSRLHIFLWGDERGK